MTTILPVMKLNDKWAGLVKQLQTHLVVWHVLSSCDEKVLLLTYMVTPSANILS